MVSAAIPACWAVSPALIAACSALAPKFEFWMIAGSMRTRTSLMAARRVLIAATVLLRFVADSCLLVSIVFWISSNLVVMICWLASAVLVIDAMVWATAANSAFIWP